MSSPFSCGCSVAVSISASAIEMVLLPLIMPSILANSCLMGQYFCMSCVMSSFLCGKPLMKYVFGSCRCSLAIASVYLILMYGLTDPLPISITLTFKLEPHISILLSLWLCYQCQSAMNGLEPGFYSMCTVYWCMHRVIYCRCCDNTATSLPIIGPNGL